MKIREVEIVADLKGVAKDYVELFKLSLVDMDKILESSHWDQSWEVMYKKSNKLEGELNPTLKKMTANQLAMRFFTRTRKEGEKTIYIVDYDIDTYYTWRNTIGYGLASDDITRVNTRYLTAYNPKLMKDRMKVGSNLIHEKYHDRGSSHTSSYNSKRPNSVAYLSNDVFEMAYDKVFLHPTSEKDPETNVPPATNLPPVSNTPPLAVETPKEGPSPVDQGRPIDIIKNPAPVTGKKVCRRTFWPYFWLKVVCSYEKT